MNSTLVQNNSAQNNLVQNNSAQNTLAYNTLVYLNTLPIIKLQQKNVIRDQLVENIWKISTNLSIHSMVSYMAIETLDRLLDQFNLSNSLVNDLENIEYFCLWISSKYQKDESSDNIVNNKIDPNKVTQYLSTIKRDDIKNKIISLEFEYFKLLNYNLQTPTLPYYLHSLSVISNVSNELYSLANYICKVSTLDMYAGDYKPCVIACAAIKIASKYDHFKISYKNLYQISKHTRDEIRACVVFLKKLLKKIQLEHCLHKTHKIAGVLRTECY